MGKSHHVDVSRATGWRAVSAAAALALLFTLSGCSTNLTGFEFPSFGLMSSFFNDDESEITKPGADSFQPLSAGNGL